MMMKEILIALLLVSKLSLLTAQVSISGRVTDSSTGKPIPSANVYLAFTQNGTATDLNGNFEIQLFSEGKQEILISFVGYKTKKVVYFTSSPKKLQIKLEVDELLLKEATIGGKKDKKWERDFRRFKRTILGAEEFAKECEILNPWHLEFKHEGNVFSAESNQLIEFRNEALGYQINYYLSDFEATPNTVRFGGIPVFKELKTSSFLEKKKWDENRRAAYHGSVRHFFKTLIAGNLDSEGYLATLIGSQLKDIPTTAEGENKPNTPHKSDEKEKILTRKDEKFYPGFRGYLQIVYSKEFIDGRPQKSWIHLNGTTSVSDQGILTNPDAVVLFGHLSTERIAHLLPFDYQPTKNVKEGFEQRFYEYNVQKFQSYFKSNFTEKIHVHTDKDLYFPGERIWLKAYINIGKTPGKVSSKFYVQLRNEEGVAMQGVFPIRQGTAEGSLALPDDLKSGNFQLLAYSEMARDLSDEFHYHKVLKIGLKDQESKTNNNELKLKVFPEGGHFVSGVDNIIAFEIYDQHNNLVNGEIEILNSRGKVVKSVKTSWQGKGKFQIKAKKKESYTVRIKSDRSSLVALEPTEKIYTAIQAFQSKNEVEIRLKSAQKERQLIHLLITSHEKIVGFKTFEVEGQLTFSLPNSGLSEGINHLVFFDINQKPIAERLVFVMPQNEVDLEIQLQEQKHKARNLEKLAINGSEVIRNASMAAVDLGQTVEVGHENIFVSHYLRPDLKGSIPDVERLFQEKKPTNFDLLMLTNGWSRYDWEDISEFNVNQRDTIEIQSGFDISGTVTFGPKKKVLANERLFLVTIDSSSTFFNTTTDDQGNFTFQDISYNDSTTVIFRHADPKFKKLLHFEFNNTIRWRKHEKTQAKSGGYLFSSEITTNNAKLGEKARYREKIAEIYNFDGKTYYLDEAVIKGEKVKESYFLPRTYRTPNTKVLDFNEIPSAKYGGNGERLIHLIDGNLSGIRIATVDNNGTGIRDEVQIIIGPANISLGSTPALFLLNNVPTDPNILLSLSPNQVETVELVKGAEAAIFGVRGASGALLVYTKDYSPSVISEEISYHFQTKLKGYESYKQFYSPDYSVEQDYIPDYRTTLYWNPAITNENREFTYYNHENKGRIKVIVEGFTEKGTPFRLVKFYQIVK